MPRRVRKSSRFRARSASDASPVPRSVTIVALENSHQDRIMIAPVQKAMIALDAFAFEATLLVRLDAADIEVIDVEPHPVEIHFVERKAQHYPHRIGAVTLAPIRFTSKNNSN